MKKLLLLTCFMSICQFASAQPAREGRSIIINSESLVRVVSLFREISRLDSNAGTTASATTCGYIFPGDGSKFGCTGSGRAAADVAAACSGGGSLACTGSGSSRTCTCAFD